MVIKGPVPSPRLGLCEVCFNVFISGDLVVEEFDDVFVHEGCSSWNLATTIGIPSVV